MFLLDIFDYQALLFYIPISLIFIIGISYIAGYLKLMRNVKTNYTRKLFHISIFTFAGTIALLGDFTGVMIFGGISTLFTIAIIVLGEGNIFFEGIARESDRPYRSLYIIMPLIATIIGGLLGQFVFGKFAVIGYFVVGFGDAVGEPIGVRFGKHIYRIPTFTKRIFIRTLEGSMAVLIVSAFISTVLISLFLNVSPLTAVLCGMFIGCAACAVEAISPHGFDNFTVQFFPLIGGYVLIYYVF